MQSSSIITNTFDGSPSANIHKFFFYFEQVVMRGKPEEEKAVSLLSFLEGDAFDLYYDSFAKDGEPLDSAKDYSAVKKLFLENYGPRQEPQDDIRRAMNVRLDSKDIPNSLQTMDRLFEKAGFNEEAKFGLLRNSVADHSDLAQFVISRSPKSYQEVKKAISDFWFGLRAYQSAVTFQYPMETGKISRSRSAVEDAIPPQSKLLVRPDSQSSAWRTRLMLLPTNFQSSL